MKNVNDPEVMAGLRELEELIAKRYPEAEFFVGGENEKMLNVLVDIDDFHDVFDDSVHDLLYELQVERELPVALVSSWTRERALAEFAKVKDALPSLPRP